MDSHHERHVLGYDTIYLNFLNAIQRGRLCNLGSATKWATYRLDEGLISKEELTPEFLLWILGETNHGRWLHIALGMLAEDEIPEKVKIAYALRDTYGEELRWLKHPSDAVINAHLTVAGQSIVDVPKPTKAQILLALSHSTETPELIKKIPKPTVQMQIIHATHCLEGIDYIEKPCERVKLAAAKAHGIEVLRQRNMQNASEQVILTAIEHTFGFKETRSFLRYIPHPNYKEYCAIRHQINTFKKIEAKWASEKDNQPKSTPDELQALMKECLISDPLRTIETCNADTRPEMQEKNLRRLHQELGTKGILELIGAKTVHTI